MTADPYVVGHTERWTAQFARAFEARIEAGESRLFAHSRAAMESRPGSSLLEDEGARRFEIVDEVCERLGIEPHYYRA